ncbi:MAG TPA: TonB-dependent receptor [Usitatibacter sp.]|nr:TonB-dependent receptor [Usitatibacter sp.]
MSTVAATLMVTFLGCPTAAHAQDAISTRELADLSLDELANLKVTSVFRRAERLADAPTAIYVITGEDIRRSGATTLPDALRLAPNLQVARVDSRTFAVSARGFNNAIGNKLLVLIDGRTVYSPLFSGTFWDQQDVMLEDVERIEVISGPGATQWGANAVDGVINVITRPAGETQGALVTGAGGRLENDYGARYGGRIAGGAFRVYAKGIDGQPTRTASGASAGDGWHREQAGFRADWGANGRDFTLQGDAYRGQGTPNVLGVPDFSGSNLLARWTEHLAQGSELRVQAYVDQADRFDTTTFDDHMTTSDVEATYSTRAGAHQVVAGGGYRYARDRTDPTLLVAFIPADKSLRWANVFLEDTMQVARDVQVTLGAKAESNVYTGWEFLPSARLAWKPSDRQLVWAALSRAVRAPARIDREFFFPGRPPFFINGGPDFVSEVANVAEIGYRVQPSVNSTLSISAFANKYDRLRSGQPPPAVVQNMIDGNASGVEMWGSYQVRPAWRLSAGVTTLDARLHVEPGSLDPTGPSALGNDPHYQAMLRSSLTLPQGIEVDIEIRHVGRLPNPVVPAYTAVDARLGWRVTRELDLALVVQNATDPSHPEFGDPASASQISRSVFLKAAWRPW